LVAGSGERRGFSLFLNDPTTLVPHNNQTSYFDEEGQPDHLNFIFDGSSHWREPEHIART
jgi:hypothetical protein